MAAMKPTLSPPGGDARVVDLTNFPISTGIAAAMVTIKPGAMREMHWHPNASEWQYWIKGKGRMTVVTTGATARTVDFNANDVGYVPSMAGHCIENTGSRGSRLSRDVQVAPVPGYLSERMDCAHARRNGPGTFEAAHFGRARGSPDEIGAAGEVAPCANVWSNF